MPSAADPAHRWHAAVRWGALGRYLPAWRLLAPDDGDLTEVWSASTDPSVSSLSWSTRASHARQVGAVEQARRWDENAIALAVDDESRADALVGITADMLAAGDVSSALASLPGAQAIAEQAGWRTATRAAWVGAEISLARQDTEAAVTHARQALLRSRGHSLRHRTKSEAILAASLLATAPRPGADGLVGEIRALLRRAFEASRQHGWITLQWPLALIALDLGGRLSATTGSQATPAGPVGIVEAGARATFTIEAHLPTQMARSWRTRPDVARLRSAAER